MFKTFRKIIFRTKPFEKMGVEESAQEKFKEVEVQKAPRPRAAEAMQKPSVFDKLKYNFKTLAERVTTHINFDIQVKEKRGFNALTAAKMDPAAVFNELNDVSLDFGMRSILERARRDSNGMIIPEDRKKILKQLNFDNLSDEQIFRLKQNLEILEKQGFSTIVESLRDLTYPKAEDPQRAVLQGNVDLFNILKSVVDIRSVPKRSDLNLVNNLATALRENNLTPLFLKSASDTRGFVNGLKFEPDESQKKVDDVKIFGKNFKVSNQFILDCNRAQYELNISGTIVKLDFKNDPEKSYEKMLQFFGYDPNGKDADNKIAADRMLEFTIWANQAPDLYPFVKSGTVVNELQRNESMPRNKAFDTSLKTKTEGLEKKILEEIKKEEKIDTKTKTDLENALKIAKNEFLTRLNSPKAGHLQYPHEVRKELEGSLLAAILPLTVNIDKKTKQTISKAIEEYVSGIKEDAFVEPQQIEKNKVFNSSLKRPQNLEELILGNINIDQQRKESLRSAFKQAKENFLKQIEESGYREAPDKVLKNLKETFIEHAAMILADQSPEIVQAVNEAIENRINAIPVPPKSPKKINVQTVEDLKTTPFLMEIDDEGGKEQVIFQIPPNSYDKPPIIKKTFIYDDKGYHLQAVFDASPAEVTFIPIHYAIDSSSGPKPMHSTRTQYRQELWFDLVNGKLQYKASPSKLEIQIHGEPFNVRELPLVMI